MGQCPAYSYVYPISDLIKKGKFDATNMIAPFNIYFTSLYSLYIEAITFVSSWGAGANG